MTIFVGIVLMFVLIALIGSIYATIRKVFFRVKSSEKWSTYFIYGAFGFLFEALTSLF